MRNKSVGRFVKDWDRLWLTDTSGTQTDLSSILVLALSSFSRICGNCVSSSHAEPHPKTLARSFPVPSGSTPSWHCRRHTKTSNSRHEPVAQTVTSNKPKITDSIHRKCMNWKAPPEGSISTENVSELCSSCIVQHISISACDLLMFQYAVNHSQCSIICS